MYNPQSISRHFDEYGEREWQRLVARPVDEISLYIHNHYLRQAVRPGNRVLEIGAGAGRFTQTLAEIGARIVVGDISAVQIDLNRQNAARYGFAQAVESWEVVDICDLGRFPAASFDALVAYGGPFSYVLDQRDRAMAECLRALKPGGALAASVMSLWGAAHSALFGTLDLPPETNQRVTSTGDLSPATIPQRKGHYMHMFRSAEARAWLAAAGLQDVLFSASGVLANASPTAEYDELMRAVRADPLRWAELLRMEIEASAEPGCLDLGAHLIFTAKRAMDLYSG